MDRSADDPEATAIGLTAARFDYSELPAIKAGLGRKQAPWLAVVGWALG